MRESATVYLDYADGPAPKAAPRKDSYVYYVK